MTWKDVLSIVADETDGVVAARIEKRVRSELAGSKITIWKSPAIVPKMIEDAAPGRVAVAAKRLGIGRQSSYQILKRIR